MKQLLIHFLFLGSFSAHSLAGQVPGDFGLAQTQGTPSHLVQPRPVRSDAETNKPDTETNKPGPGPSTAQSAFAAGHNHFAFRLLDAVVQHDSSRGNIAISPLGLYLSLGMVYNGTDHATRDSVAEVLGASGFGAQNLNNYCRDLLRDMSQQEDRSEFMLANSIWNNRSKGPTLAAFDNLCESYYYTPVKSVNFNAKSTTAQINKWADQSTRHRVNQIVGTANAGDHIYLVNAMSFRSDWADPFDTADTRDEVFVTSRGRARNTPFMKKEMVARIYSDTSFTMVALPYGNGKDYTMYLVLPDDPERPIQDFMSSFSESRMYEAIDRMNDKWVAIYLPRWQTSYAASNMTPVLRDMGLGILLNDYGKADLSMMCKTHNSGFDWNAGELFSRRGEGRARQSALPLKAFCKTYISINEQGAQTGPAGAAPANTAYTLRKHQASLIRMDRPFIYVIVSRQQQAILMAGVVNDPSMIDGLSLPMVSPVRSRPRNHRIKV